MYAPLFCCCHSILLFIFIFNLLFTDALTYRHENKMCPCACGSVFFGPTEFGGEKICSTRNEINVVQPEKIA